MDIKDKASKQKPSQLQLDRWLDRIQDDMDVTREVAMDRGKDTLKGNGSLV